MSNNRSSQGNNLRFITLSGMMLSLLALILSALLVCKHSGVCTSSFGCSIDGVDGCAELGQSKYSKITLPFISSTSIPIAWFGFFYYSLMFLLLLQVLIKKKTDNGYLLKLVAGLATFGFVFDIFLAYRNFFVLVNPCLLCSYTYLCQIGILFSSFWLYFSSNDDQSTRQTKRKLSIRIMEDWKGVHLPIVGAILFTLLLSIIISLSNHVSPSTTTQNINQINGLLPNSKVSGMLRELHSLKKIDVNKTGLNLYSGGEGAYIDIHEWIDFRCPHCREASHAMTKLLARWPGRINLYYRYFPLDASCNPHIERKQPGAASCKGAQAALCSGKQKYYENFIHQLFDFQQSRTNINYTSLRELTGELGGDWASIRSCMVSAKTKVALKKDIETAKKIDISATPTLILNGHQLPAGFPEMSWLRRVLDALVLEKEGEAAIEDYQSRSSTSPE